MVAYRNIRTFFGSLGVMGWALHAYATDISPSSGPAAGGNAVVLTNAVPAIGDGNDITNVTFGGTSVGTILGQGTNWVTVTAPAHAAGAVDIVTYSASLGIQTQENAYTYNPAGSINDNVTQGWTEVAGLPEVRWALGAGTINGSLYAFGGYDGSDTSVTNAYRFDGTNWTEVSGLPQARAVMGYTSFSGSIYSICGDSGSATTNVFIFNGTNWANVAGMPATRRYGAAGTLSNRIFYIGGSSGFGAGTNVYEYNGTSWSNVIGLPVSRSRLSAVEMGGLLYAIAGDDGGGAGETNVYAYNGTSWTQVQSFPGGRRNHHASVIFNGKIFTIGGALNGSTAQTNMYLFDGTNWTEGVGLPAPRAGLAAAVAGGYIYAIAGSDFAISTRTNVYRYSEASTAVSPSSGSVTGGYSVTISGANLGDGADITNVTLCGFSATSIDSQSATQVVVTAAAGSSGLGDVRVYSTSYGETVKSNYFTYTGPTMTVLGTNNMPVINNEPAHSAEGTDFGSITWGSSITNILQITNSGNSALTISSWTTNGSGAASFGVVQLPSSVAAGTVSNFVLQFSPSVGGTFTAAVSIANDSTSTPYVVNLSGTGAKQDQTISFPAIGDQETTNAVGLSATATSGLTVSFAVGSGSASISGGTNLMFTGAGSVSIIASQSGDTNWNAAPDMTNTFNVTKAVAGVTLNDLAQTYNGSARVVTATTAPTGLVVDITYDGNAFAPTNAGSYAITGVVNDVMYQGSQTGTLVVGQATASVYLESLSQTYDGSPKSATATTDPSGLTVTFTYDGNGGGPINVGSVVVTGTVSDVNYQGSASGTLTINAADQTISFPVIGDQETTNLVGLAATATSGLGVTFAVGSGSASISGGTNLMFTGAGGVSIIASQAGDANWNPAPDVTNTFNVTKAVAGVTLNDLAQTYDGSARIVTATTAPTGLTVDVTYDGSSTAPTNVGSYTVTGVVNDVMYQGNQIGTLMVYKATAAIYLESLSQSYDGSAKSATATTMPSGLTMTFTYDGSSTSPSNAGSYAVTGTVVDINYQGTNSGTLTIGQASQTITFNPIGEQIETNLIGLAATADSGLGVTFTVGSGPASISGGTNLSFTGGGSVSIVASQVGDANWNPAPDVTNTFNVLGLYTLNIQSLYGVTIPAVGLYTNLQGTVLTNVVTTPDIQSTTQYVCSGWIMAGNDPASGSGTQVVMTVTNDATLTWLWTTNYYLDIDGSPQGTLDVGDGWYLAGTTLVITATANPYYHFDVWSVDDTSTNNPLSLLMDGSKILLAHFAPNVTTNTGTPEAWLAEFGFTNDFEQAAIEDSDGDGVISADEYSADTSPTNSDSFLRIQSIDQNIEWAGGTSVIQYLESSLEVGSGWSVYATNLPPTPVTNSVVSPNDSDARFFRIRAVR